MVCHSRKHRRYTEGCHILMQARVYVPPLDGARQLPVDLGLWSDLIDKSTLIIPMDTHVLQEAEKLGLISSKCTSMSAAMKLTQKLREIWPDDPTKGDFALFGLGVDK